MGVRTKKLAEWKHAAIEAFYRLDSLVNDSECDNAEEPYSDWQPCEDGCNYCDDREARDRIAQLMAKDQ